jgi:phytanoyl-CoA hydroxylase
MTQTAEAATTPAAAPEAPGAPAAGETTFDPHEAGEFPPDLYQYVGTATGVDGFDAITEAQLREYDARGFLVVNNAFTPAEVDCGLEGLADLIDGQRPDFRGIQFEAKARSFLHTLSRDQKQDYVRKLISYVEYDPRLKALSIHARLQALVTRLLGEAPALFADQALLKPPLIGREKPWHQDHAYFNVPLGTRVVGCWIALDEATPENGCMHVVPGSHREGPVVHFKRRDWQICDTGVDRYHIYAVPLKPGGMLVFDGLLHHGTPPSQSPKRRRALQFHYIPASVGRISSQERLAVFGSEGKDVEC